MALRIWLNRQEYNRSEDHSKLLEAAWISHDPLQWMPIFYPEWAVSEKDITEDEFVEGDDGQVSIPSLEGVKVRWTKPPSQEEMEEIFKTLVGDPTGTLTAQDTMQDADSA